MGWQDKPDYTTAVTILNGAAIPADGVDLGGKTLCGVVLPASFAGAALKFLTAETLSGTYVEVQDGAGADYTVVPTASKYVPVDSAKFLGVRFLKIQSASVQTGDRVVQLVTREF